MTYMFRKLLTVLVAVLAVAAAGAASASAAECPGTGSGVVLCGGGHVQEGIFAFTGKSASGEKRIEIQHLESFTCGSSSSSGQFAATKTNVEITKLVTTWSKCSFPGCTVKPIVLGQGEGLKGLLSGTVAVTLSPITGTLFTEVSISECEQAGAPKVTGSLTCSLHGSTVEAVAHTETCEPSGSKLFTTTGHPVTLTFNEEIRLTSGKEFSLKKS